MIKVFNCASAKLHYLLFLLSLIVFHSSGYTQTILKGPYLIEPGEDKMKIRWETDSQVQGSVRYGLGKNLTDKIDAKLRGVKNGGYLYEVLLSGLTPGSDYYYSIIFDSTQTVMRNFKTYSPTGLKFSFVAMGDSRSNPQIFQKIINNVQLKNPDLIISMGDLVANGGNYSEWNEFYFSVAKDQIDHIPLVSTLGDHEGSGDDGELFRHFLRTDQTTDKQWFSFDYGSAHFVSLDYRHPENREMIDWFIRDIELSDAHWIFVYMHRPCYNLGGHRSAWGRGIWPDLFKKYNVDIVFAGHSHQYERFYPLRPESQPSAQPVTYITTGGAGAGLYDVTQNTYLAKAESVNHYVYFEISGDTLRARAIRNDDSLLDEFTMIKNDSTYDDDYLAFVKPQEDLDILTMFMRSVSLSLASIPLDDHPSRAFLNLKSPVDDEIAFTVKLSDKSEKFYQMDSVSSTLKSHENEQISLSIFSMSDITISRWGNISPPLILSVTYKYRDKEYIIDGGAIEYWPGDDAY